MPIRDKITQWTAAHLKSGKGLKWFSHIKNPLLFKEAFLNSLLTKLTQYQGTIPNAEALPFQALVKQGIGMWVIVIDALKKLNTRTLGTLWGYLGASPPKWEKINTLLAKTLKQQDLKDILNNMKPLVKQWMQEAFKKFPVPRAEIFIEKCFQDQDWWKKLFLWLKDAPMQRDLLAHAKMTETDLPDTYPLLYTVLQEPGALKTLQTGIYQFSLVVEELSQAKGIDNVPKMLHLILGSFYHLGLKFFVKKSLHQNISCGVDILQALCTLEAQLVALVGKIPERDSTYDEIQYQGQLNTLSNLATQGGHEALKNAVLSAHVLKILWQWDFHKQGMHSSIEEYIKQNNLHKFKEAIIARLVHPVPLDKESKHFSEQFFGSWMGCFHTMLISAQDHQLQDTLLSLKPIQSMLECWDMLLRSPGVHVASVGNIPGLISGLLDRRVSNVVNQLTTKATTLGFAPELFEKIAQGAVADASFSSLFTPKPSPFKEILQIFDRYLVHNHAASGRRRLAAAKAVLEQLVEFYKKPIALKRRSLAQKFQWMRLQFGGVCLSASLFGSGKGLSVLLKPLSWLFSAGWSLLNQFRGLFASHRFADQVKVLQTCMEKTSQLDATGFDDLVQVNTVLGALNQDVIGKGSTALSTLPVPLLHQYGFLQDKETDIQKACFRLKKQKSVSFWDYYNLAGL